MDYKFSGVVTKVVDGDTLDVVVDLGFKISYKVRVRLANIDTPEINSSDEIEREKAKAAKEYVIQQLMNKTVVLESKELDKYGRSVGIITAVDSTISINDLLLLNGYAKVYQ